MATLTGQKIKDSYKDLLQVSNSNSGIDGTLRTISDGEATDSVLQISSSAVNISSAGALQYAGTAITSTAAELNILDGVTASTAELNILDGVTSTTAELNILDGATVTVTELNYLDGADSSITTLSLPDNTTITTFGASLVDDADAATARTTLGVDAAGTDNSTNVTLVTTSHDYLSISGQAITLGTIDISDDTNLVGGTGITLTGDTLSTTDSEIVHDSLSGFVANEHINHSSVSITAGTGLSGGGDLTTTRTLSTNDSEIVHDNLSGFVGNEHIDHSGVTITAGSGLTGGGDITTTRTLNVGAGTHITVNADDVAVNTTTLFSAPDFTGTATGVNLTLSGDLTVNGTTTTINSTTVTVDDPIFTLGGDTAPASDDNKDRGIEFRWHNGSAAKVGFFGYDDSAEVFTFIQDATNTSEVFSGSAGNVAFGNIAGTLTTASQTNITGVGALNAGSITSGFGAIDNGSSNITTTGTISFGSLTDGSITIADIKDEDDLVSDSATSLVTQQSIKAYIDAQIISASEGDITAVTAGDGLTGGATSGAATLNIGAGTGIDVAADAISVDVSDFMTNGSDNRVLTATGTDAMNAESNLTFDGSSNLDLLSDSGKLRIGADSELEIYHNGTNDFIDSGGTAMFFRQGTTEKLKFNSAGNIQFNNAQADINTRFGTTGSTNTLWIDGGTDSVGIGTNSPNAKFEVSGSTNSDLFSLEGAGTSMKLIAESGDASSANVMTYRIGMEYLGTYTNGFIDFYRGGGGTDGYLTFGTSGTEKMRIDSSGNVGIGTSILGAGAKLNVVSGSTAYTAQFSRLDADDGLFLHSEAAGTHYNWLISTQDNVDAGFEITPSTAVGNRSFTTPAFVIKADTGNVGIGTTSPAHKLDVNGGIRNYANGSAVLRTESTAAGYGAYNKLITTTNTYDLYALNGDFIIDENGVATRLIIEDTTGNVMLPNDNQKLIIGANSDLEIYHDGTDDIINTKGNAFKLLDNGTEKLRVTAGGHIIINENGNDQNFRVEGDTDANLLFVDAGTDRVGIGTNSPTAKLDVRGNVSFFSSDASDFVSFTHSDNGIIINSAGSTSNKMFLRTGGSDALTIDASQNVGIGTASPSAKLDIVGSGNTGIEVTGGSGNFAGYFLTDYDYVSKFESSDAGAAIVLEDSNSTSNYNRIGVTTHDMFFVTNNSEAMRIDSSQNVGIGTNSPSVKLDVAGGDIAIDATQKLYLDGGSNTYITEEVPDQITLRAGGGNYFKVSPTNGVVVNDPGANVDFRVEGDTNTHLLFADASTSRVGIGTSSPDTRLDITAPGANGMIINQDVNDATNSSRVFFKNSSGTYSMYKVGDYLRVNSGATAGSSSGATNLISIGSSVGIGTSSPTSKLHVKNATDISMDASGNGQVRIEGNAYALGIALNASGSFIYNNSSSRFLSLGTNETEQARLTTGGAWHVVDDVVAFSTTPSDKKLKTNIKDIDYGLDTIMKLKPKQYDWKKDDRHDIGFIAQEVEEVIPEIVKDNEWFDDKIKTLDYEKLTAVLIKAVQEQQQQINELKEKLNG